MRVAKEIACIETAPGVFGLAPTRSQKRAAKREAEAKKKRRNERWEKVGGYLVVGFVVSSYLAIMFVWIFAETIWPMR